MTHYNVGAIWRNHFCKRVIRIGLSLILHLTVPSSIVDARIADTQ